MEKSTKKILTKKKGVVISDTMDKTIVVAVERFETHPKYKKKVRVTKNYKVHDASNLKKVGDKVEFIPCRPISKDKNYVLV